MATSHPLTIGVHVSCTVCDAEQVNGETVDTSISKQAWADRLGVTRSAVQRHMKHGTKTRNETLPSSSEASSDGSRTVTAIRDRPVTLDDARDWIRTSGDDPDNYTLSIRAIAYGTDMFSNRMSATPKRAAEAEPTTYDLPTLYAASRAERPTIRPAAVSTQRATVVVFADPQIGKVGRRGGTPELLDRMQEKRETLANLLAIRNPSQTALFDGGDGFEGFNSGGNPMFTNDLSLAQQMDCYGTELYEFVNVLTPYGRVDIAAVTSNHTAWRNGKQNLGRPADDLGLYVHKQVSRVADAARLNTSWHIPLEYDESVAVDILGTSVGMVHGNQFGPGGAINWWEKQTFGAGAVALADVLLTAHYHTFGAGVAGRNPHTGKQRYWLGAPTLDNGSDWYRQTAGRDSDPGLLVFDITPDGFDLGSLIVL
jgi:hypothetical protein